MTQTTVTRIPLTNPPRTGSANQSRDAEEAGFAATMTAVVTVNVSDDDEDTKGGSTTSTTQGTTEDETAGEMSSDVEIEIEITTLEGDGLAENLSVTSKRGTAEISISTDGDIGISTDARFFSDNPEIQMGETLTFTVPESLDNVQGATIKVSNLVDSKTGAESALVIAYDAEGKEVLRCVVEGNESGDVTVDIDVSFSKIDFKPVDNGSWTLSGNSDFTIERIDIKTGDTSDRGDAPHQRGSFLADFQGFFEQRNYGLQRNVLKQRQLSLTEIARNWQPTEDYQRVDEAALKELDQREKTGVR